MASHKYSHKYNGWSSRETWLVNIWFGDTWESVSDVEYTEEYIDEEVAKLPTWLQDFLYMGSINWEELKESVEEEVEEEIAKMDFEL